MKQLLYAIAILSIIMIVSESWGGQEGPYYRLYMEHGGMNVTEQGVSEGHKSYHTLGGEIFFENMRAKALFGVEGFIRGEPADEDPEIMCAGASSFIEYSYKWTDFVHPYLGVRYDHFTRATAPKYETGNYQQETEHDIVSARAGGHFQYGWFWCDWGVIIPFYTNTKSGNFGPDLGVGIKWNNWDVGYRFREYVMTDHHFQGDESLSFYFSGVQLGYKF